MTYPFTDLTQILTEPLPHFSEKDMNLDKFQRRFCGCMTVADLRSSLVDLPDGAIVMLAADYGDRSHTTQLLPVEATRPLSLMAITESGYSGSGYRLRDRDESEEAAAECENCDIIAVVLGGEDIDN